MTVAQVPKMLFLPSTAEITSPADPRVVAILILLSYVSSILIVREKGPQHA